MDPDSAETNTSVAGVPAQLLTFQELLARIGVVKDPFRFDVTVKYIRYVHEMVREARGEEASRDFLDRLTDDHVPADEETRGRFVKLLRDEHGWVNVWLSVAAVLRSALVLGRADIPRQVAFGAIADRTSAHAAFAGVLGLPWLYRHITEANKNFNNATALSCDATASGPGRALIRKKTLDWYSAEMREIFGDLTRDMLSVDCEMTEGGMAAIPLLFARPAATARHLRCETEGADACEILVEWQAASLLRRIRSSLQGLLPSHRRLLAKVGQLEVLIRDRTARLEEAHRREMSQSRRLAEAEAQVAMGKTYAASAAHDINNALGPARRGIEDILEVLREARPLPREFESPTEAAEADFAGRLGGVVEEKLGEVIGAFEKVAGGLSAQEVESLLRVFEFFTHLTKTMRGAIPEIYHGINRASDFSAFMSEVARIDYAEKRRSVRVDELLDGLAEKYRKIWKKQGIELTCHIEASAEVQGWPYVFESVFSNLLENAALSVAGSAEKRVRVRLGVAGDRCVVSVTDTGPGIADELKDKIFKFGFTTRPARGKGFGLGYVKNYVLLLGGEIEVASPPGSGASFSLDFPIAQG